jgi:NADPH:quinone reductase-like Zn-dependent oxidoreductase
MKALVIESLGAPGKITLQEVKEPDVKSGWLKVKTVAVALNPSLN